MIDVNKDFDDEPIKAPAEDSFGVDRLAEAIADCIEGIRNPVGSVIAINGPWGSGKSSVINLVRHHLGKKKFREPKVITFHCWWYRGEEALTLGFFKELQKGLSPDLPKIRKVFLKLGAHVATASPLIEEFAPAGSRGIVKILTSVLGNYISGGDSVEGLRNTIYKALDNQDQRFLVIIDDLDRLSPDEVLLIFRLIKSVGRLPKITYLISYDRKIVEQAITERHKAEGGKHYLEKMVQAAFEIPTPAPARLNDMMWLQIDKIFRDSEQPADMRLADIFDRAVMPELRTPRDVVRLGNALSTTWGAVRDHKVNITDFVGLETLRLFRPDLHRAVGGNESELTDPNVIFRGKADDYDQLILSSEPEKLWARLRDVLMVLFPQLGQVWGRGTQIGTEHWVRDHRVCASGYFDTYFRFNSPDMMVSDENIRAIIRRSDDSEFVKATFKEALSLIEKRGRTKASHLLDALISYGGDFPKELVGPFINIMLSMADEFWKYSDESGLTSGTSNPYRLFRLTRTLTRNRFTLEERSNLIRAACETASLGWLVYFSRIARAQYVPRAGDIPHLPDEILMTEEHMHEVEALALQRIHAARDDGTLIKLPDLPSVLAHWRDGGGEALVKVWMVQTLKQDEDVGRLAKAFLGSTWSVGGRSDRQDEGGVKRRDRVRIDSMKWIMEPYAFKRRFEEVRDGGNVSDKGRENIERLLNAWDDQD